MLSSPGNRLALVCLVVGLAAGAGSLAGAFLGNLENLELNRRPARRESQDDLTTVGRFAARLNGVPGGAAVRQKFEERKDSLKSRRCEDTLAKLQLGPRERWDRRTSQGVLSFVAWWMPGCSLVGQDLQAMAALDPGVADWPYHLGELFHRRGHLDRAEAAYTRAIETDSGFALAYLQLGLLHEERAKRSRDAWQWHEAIRWYQQYLALRPEDLRGLKHLAGAHAALGEAVARTLGEALDARTNIRLIAGSMLGAGPEGLGLGPDLVGDHQFESAAESLKAHWTLAQGTGASAFFGSRFAGGADTFQSYAARGALRLVGFQVHQVEGQAEAWAGFWFDKTLSLKPLTPYVMSFKYRTVGVRDGGAAVWSSPPPYTLYSEVALPGTNGDWRQFVLVGWTGDRHLTIQPLLRSYAIGTVWFDSLEVREVISNSVRPLTPSQTTFQVR